MKNSYQYMNFLRLFQTKKYLQKKKITNNVFNPLLTDTTSWRLSK